MSGADRPFTRAWQCECSDTALRTRRIRGGGIQYVAQCQVCGRAVGQALKHSDVAVLPPYWDEDLHDQWSAEQRELVAAELAERELVVAVDRAERSAEYAAYLQTPEWRTRRAAVLQRDRYVCQGCLSARAVEVHHLTYRNVGHELFYQLVSLCAPCHERAHTRTELRHVDE